MLGDLTGEHPEDGSLFLISPHCRRSERVCDRSSPPFFFSLLFALVGAGRMSQARGGTICQNISGLNTRVNSLTSCKHVGGREARGENIYNKLEFLITHIKRLRGNFVSLGLTGCDCSARRLPRRACSGAKRLTRGMCVLDARYRWAVICGVPLTTTPQRQVMRLSEIYVVRSHWTL